MPRNSRIIRTLSNAPTPELFRTDPLPAPADAPRIVDRTGGSYGAGLIRGVSLITRGPALGHGLWIDSAFLVQLSDAMAAAAAGVKSRFTHPDMSSDGLAKFLGRTRGGLLDGDRVLGDLHLAKSARRSPDGDLAGYVMQRTEEDPRSFGASIVFYRDEAAELEFAGAHGAEIEEDEWGPYVSDWSGFVSPDPDNTGHLRHARLAALEAADLVDEPAANPNGLLSRAAGPVAQFAALADYALGRTATAPEAATAMGVHPDRIRGFVQRYLRRRGLQIIPITAPGDQPVSTHATPDDATPVTPAPDPAATAPPAAAPAPDPTAAPPAAPATDPPPAAGDTAAPAAEPTPAAACPGCVRLQHDNDMLRAALVKADHERLATIQHPAPLAAGRSGNKRSLKDLIKIRR